MTVRFDHLLQQCTGTLPLHLRPNAPGMASPLTYARFQLRKTTDLFLEIMGVEIDKKTRMTPQRRVILEEIRRTNNHPAADEIYARVRKRLPRISLGTVYRNLDVLCELGEIQRLELSGAVKRYDGIAKKHYHIRCVCCGRVDDAPIAPLNELEDDLYGTTVYEIIGHNLEFTGLCPQCTMERNQRQAAS
jgi:Fe2+ or Zn2+ uptake regulation protein